MAAAGVAIFAGIRILALWISAYLLPRGRFYTHLHYFAVAPDRVLGQRQLPHYRGARLFLCAGRLAP